MTKPDTAGWDRTSMAILKSVERMEVRFDRFDDKNDAEHGEIKERLTAVETAMKIKNGVASNQATDKRSRWGLYGIIGAQFIASMTALGVALIALLGKV